MTGIRVKHHKSKGAFIKFGFVTYLCFCLFAIVWMRAAVVNLEYELGDLDGMRADLSNERKYVSAQRANIYSTEKIEKVALRRLNMKMPDRERVYYVKRSSAAVAFKASMR
jgi:cell division protein FtsL